jgi:hypothetical protein
MWEMNTRFAIQVLENGDTTAVPKFSCSFVLVFDWEFGKGSGANSRNGPPGASHHWCLTRLNGTVVT